MDRLLREFGQRRLTRFAMTALVFLYGIAAFAPLIANDRPYAMTVVDRRGYREGLGALSAISAEVQRLVASQEVEGVDRRAAMVLEARTARRRLRQIEASLPAEKRAALEPWRESLQAVLRAQERGDVSGLKSASEGLLERARNLRVDLRAADPEQPDQDGVMLVPQRRYPIFEGLRPIDIGAMTAWLVLVLVLLSRLLRSHEPARAGARSRSPGRRLLTAALWFLPLGGAGLWALSAGSPGRTLETRSLKEDLQRGELVLLETPLFPPLAYGPAETHTLEGLRPPSWAARAGVTPAPQAQVRYAEPPAASAWRWLAGTDSLGRDLATRLIWGARVSLSVGILSAALLTLIGVLVGALAGYFGGWVDFMVLRTIEVLQSVPAFFFVLLAMAFTDPRVVSPLVAIVVVIALVRWTGAARLVRGEFLRLREREFVLAARSLGYSNARIVLRHVLPNALGPVLVHAAFAVAAGILTESAISYLGFGIQYPQASWGSLINESRSPEHWWIQVFPGLLIFLTVTCYNLVGDAVRDALDPRVEK